MTFSTKILASAMAIIALQALSGAALADPLPAGTNEIVVRGFAGALVGGIPVTTSFSNYPTIPGNYSTGASAGGASVLATMVVANTPVPSVVSSALLLPGLGIAANTSADLNSFSLYYMQVNGAAGEATVRVNAFGEVGFSTFTAPQGLGSASALFRVEKQLGGDVLIDNFIDASRSADPRLGPYDSAFTVNRDFQFVTNTPYVVRLRTILHFQEVIGGGEASGYANLDPTFSVAGPYTLQFSEGFGGGLTRASVPEPATWALMIMGFGAAGSLIRRRRVLSAV